MFDITFLGTAASVPTAGRGLPALVVRHGSHRFLVDCGEGTQRQLIHSGIGFRRLDRVLLTHGHLDHMLGLAGLAGTVNLWATAERLAIYAGPATLPLIKALLHDIVWPEGLPTLALDFITLDPDRPVLQTRDLTVTTFPVRHRAPDCFGFIFAEPPRNSLLGDQLDRLGVPAGPERGRLIQGQTVTLPDGRIIHPDAVMGPPIRGRKLAVIGDAETTDGLADAVRGADVLVIEGTFLDADAAKARERSHLTVGEAARFAAAAEVGKLCLTHLSSRYEMDSIEQEARLHFPNVHVARDFDHIQVS